MMDCFFKLATLMCAGVLLAVLAGCGGGGGGGESSAAGSSGGQADPLAGTWFGSVEDNTGQLHTFRLTIAGAHVTAFDVDGVAFGGKGALARNDAQIFSSTVTFPTGQQLQVVLFADPAAKHFVYLDNYFEFGILQRDAAALPAYSSVDINNTWRGISTFTDFNEFRSDPSSAICIVGECSVTEIDDRMREKFTAGFDSVYGRWLGTTTITLPNHPDVDKISRAFVSPDKKFMGVWRCLVGVNGDVLFPGKCTYSAWVKT